MPIKNESSTHFMDEVRIISPVAFVIAALAFVGINMIVIWATLHDPHRPPLAAMIAVGIFAGTALAGVILLIGYVNRDAGRRGMNRTLWTLIAMFIPNALGIVLYFILRKPRPAACPQCSAVVEPGFGFCPKCRYRLTPVCPHCQRSVHPGDKFCPYCGTDVEAPVAAAPVSVQS